MRSDKNAFFCRPSDRCLSFRLCVTTIHSLQSSVQRTFDAIFNQYKTALRQLPEIMQQLLTHAVRSRTHHQTNHIRTRQCLLILLNQFFSRTIGVGIRLEVSQILHACILSGEEMDTCLHLFANRFYLPAILGAESPVITVRTSAHTFRSIPVRTTASRINSHLLHLPVRESLLQKIAIGPIR